MYTGNMYADGNNILPFQTCVSIKFTVQYQQNSQNITLNMGQPLTMGAGDNAQLIYRIARHTQTVTVCLCIN